MVSIGDRLVLWAGFGGCSDCQIFMADTWEYSLAGWRQIAATPAPSYRACGAWDSDRRVVVSFGGASAPGSSAEIHEYDPAAETWTHIPVDTLKPKARLGAAMCFVPGWGCLMTGGGPGEDEAWRWDGQLWEYLGPVPEPVYIHSLVWDPRRRRAVQCGGLRGTESVGTTWFFEPWSRAWSRGPDMPDVRYLQAFSYVPDCGVFLCAGRQTGGTLFRDLWCLNLEGWRMIAPEAVTDRFCSQMAWLPIEGLILFGGENGSRLGDTVHLAEDSTPVVHFRLY